VVPGTKLAREEVEVNFTQVGGAHEEEPMKSHLALRNSISLIALGAFLAACSGGTDQVGSSNRTVPAQNISPTPSSPSIPPISGPVNVGSSTTAGVDDVNDKADQILEKLNALGTQVDSIEGDSRDAKKNSSWAKNLGIGILALLGLQMGNNAYRTYQATGSMKHAAKAFVFNDNSKHTAKRVNDHTTTEVDRGAGVVNAKVTEESGKLGAGIAGATATTAAGIASSNRRFDQVDKQFANVEENAAENARSVIDGARDEGDKTRNEIAKESEKLQVAIKDQAEQTRATLISETARIAAESRAHAEAIVEYLSSVENNVIVSQEFNQNFARGIADYLAQSEMARAAPGIASQPSLDFLTRLVTGQ
jgi:hypothetical protein